jgi:hypothetical protein
MRSARPDAEEDACHEPFNPEFRRRVLVLVEVWPVRVVAVKLGLAEATVYRRKVRDLIDRGLQAETLDQRAHELATANRLIMGHPGLFGSAAAADMVPGAQGRCGDRGPVIAGASRSLQSEHPC